MSLVSRLPGPDNDDVTTVAIPGEEASIRPEELAAVAKSIGLDAEPAVGVSMALEEISRNRPGPGRVLIAGSLYLAGKVLADNGDKGLESGK